eukprot:IDg11979t1
MCLILCLPTDAKRSVFVGAQCGNMGASIFDDKLGYKNGERVLKIKVHSDQFGIRGIVFTTQYRTLAHGHSIGASKSLSLGRREVITKYEACYSNWFRWISFTTSSKKTISAGIRTTYCCTFTIPPSATIFGMKGRAGDSINMIGMVGTAPF